MDSNLQQVHLDRAGESLRRSYIALTEMVGYLNGLEAATGKTLHDRAKRIALDVRSDIEATLELIAPTK